MRALLQNTFHSLLPCNLWHCLAEGKLELEYKIGLLIVAVPRRNRIARGTSESFTACT